jgi:hypothetical protein
MASTKQIIVTTDCPTTAHLFGYDGPCDYRDDTEGLQVAVEYDRQIGPIFTLNGPDGEIVLYRAEAKEVAAQLLAAIASADRMASAQAERAAA